MGDVANMCERVDRLGNFEQAILRTERKVDMLVDMMKPVVAAFGDKGIRVAIGAALTSELLRALRK